MRSLFVCLGNICRSPTAEGVVRHLSATATTRLFLDYAPASGLVDLPDPYYGEEEGLETVLNLCEEAGRGLLTALADHA